MKSLYFSLAKDNIFKNKRIYFPYIFSITFLVAVFYIINSLSYNEGLMCTKGGEVVTQFLIFGSYVITIFSLIFVFYSNSFMIKSRRKELGLYNILGLEKRHVILVVFIEFIYISLLSLIVGLCLGIFLEKLAFIILLNMLDANIPLGFDISPKSILITLGLYFGLLFLAFIYNAFSIRHYTAVNLLKSENVGEKEPKARMLLALVGFILLGFGYGIALSVKEPQTAIALFFVAVILVIIGTYLLFVVGVTAVLKMLKSKKTYYYKTTHFISVSMLLYRMKKNAVGLANICILSTMVLVMISSTSALWFYTRDIIGNIQPDAYSISVSNMSKEEIIKADEIASEYLSKDQYFAYNELQLPSEYVNSENLNIAEYTSQAYIAHFITLDAYNHYTNQSIKLADDEVIIINELGLDFAENINLLGNQFRVIKNEDEYVQGIHLSNTISNGEIQIVVKDDNLLSSLFGTFDRYYSINDKGTSVNVIDDIANTFIAELSDDVYVFSLSRAELNDLMVSLYAGLFFLGIFLSIVFIMAMILIIYYKQIQEGSEDQKRFEIMKKVGLTNSDINKTIKSQVWIVFFLPLIVAIVHMLFAYNIISELLSGLSMIGSFQYLPTFVISIAIFIIFYAIIYKVTSKIYYRLVTI